MNIKINTICFILLFFLLISAASAADSDNETLENENQPDPNQDIDNLNYEKLQMSCEIDDAVSKSVESESELGAANLRASLVEGTIKATQKVAKLKVSLKAPNVKMHYKDGSKFKATLKDHNGKAMKNAKVKINRKWHLLSVEETGTVFSNTTFGLYASTVGPDETHTDFLEHIE